MRTRQGGCSNEDPGTPCRPQGSTTARGASTGKVKVLTWPGQGGGTELNMGAGLVQSRGENGTLAVHSKDDIKYLQGLSVSSYPDLQTGSVITHFRHWLTFLFLFGYKKAICNCFEDHTHLWRPR